jgi:hypothetical protein
LDEQTHRPALPAWPGADEGELTVACGAMARRLSASPARVIGVVPAAEAPNLGPLLVRVAGALAGFVGGRVGVVPRWRSWGKDSGAADDDVATLRLRAMGPDVVAIVPAASANARVAALAVQDALWSLPAGIARVLVDLSGYSAAGHLPGAGALADGLVLAVPARRARRARVEKLLAAIPEGKALGTILVG